jgi:thimet oligopeptidase
MTEAVTPRVADLEPLPFSLSADELRSRGKEVLEKAEARLASLIARRGRRTIDSFLEPLNRILVEVKDLSLHGSFLFQVHPDPTLRLAGRELSEAADQFFNRFRVNLKVYRRVRSVDLSEADATTRLAVEKLQREMERAGVEQTARKRARLLALANRLDSLANQFNENIANGSREVVLDGPSALRGLPDDFLVAHRPGPDGKIRISTKYPDCFPVMRYAEDAEVRRRLLLEFMNVGFPENLTVLSDLLKERRAFVRLLGYSDFAAYALEDKMAGTPEVVVAFLDRVAALLGEPAKKEMARFLTRKKKDHPAATRVEDWDARFWTPGYYDTKIRQEEYGIDLKKLRSYLPYAAVRDGLFALCKELFELEFVRDTTTPVWHPSVEAYDVHRAGVPIGRCYLDLVPRPGKYNHAAQFDVRVGVSGGALPQDALVCNFLNEKTPPEEARMEYGDVVTFFHEFGHLIHALLSGHGRWLYATMEHVEWDFVEAPSQLFEEWARDPATLSRFARDPATGKAIPESVVARLKESEALGRAISSLRQVALASLSLEIHRRDPRKLDGSRLFREVYEQRTSSPLDVAYHPLASFGHLTGYSAFYYTYLWSAVIARDLLTPFEERGSLTDRATAERYAAEVLVPGGSRAAADLVRSFLGRDYTFDAFERWVLEGSQRP